MIASTGHPGNAELWNVAVIAFDNGVATALLESDVCPPPVQYMPLDYAAAGPPLDSTKSAARMYALGCLLAVVDDQGTATEADLRELADALGGEEGHRHFRLLRRVGLIEYTLTRDNTGTVSVPEHHRLRAQDPSG